MKAKGVEIRGAVLDEVQVFADEVDLAPVIATPRPPASVVVGSALYSRAVEVYGQEAVDAAGFVRAQRPEEAKLVGKWTPEGAGPPPARNRAERRRRGQAIERELKRSLRR